MNRRAQRGAVLVASLITLALLSLLGAASLMNATLDTQLSRNLRSGSEAFYASEAALETGVGRVTAAFRDELRPFVPTNTWIEPAVADGDPYDNPFNGFTTRFRIRNALDPVNPATEPDPVLFTTVENGQQLLHFAYSYEVEAEAVADAGNEKMAETLRVLETPLIQYYIFFDDDLSWHNGPTMTSWGRVHTNGNMYFAPNAPIWFRNYDDANFETTNLLTAGGNMYVGSYLKQEVATAPNSGTLTRTSGGVNVRVGNIHTIPAASGDWVNLNTSITAANQAVQEARFLDSEGAYHVRVGVDNMPSASIQSLGRGGFYEQVADAPKKPDVDGMKIVSDAGAITITFIPNGGVTDDVTDLVRNYWVDALGSPVDFASWPMGARTNADQTVAANVAALVPGTIVYAPEQIVATDEAGGGPYTAARGGAANPSYPCVLETKDGRQNRDVDLTVIDVQRLEYWYSDYLDWSDNGAFDNSVDMTTRKLLIYVSRSASGGGFVTGSGTGALQAIKLIGSRAGRTRGSAQATDRQTSPTFVVPTTIATDNPMYFDGDFNAPGGGTAPGGVGSAVISDATTLLSNAWGSGPNVFNQTGGVYTTSSDYVSSAVGVYNTALFTGRYNFRLGGGGEEAGVHNFPSFLERWTSSRDCYITGCLINLWFSAQATAKKGSGYYSPPARHFGWDTGFATQSYWPPYVPSIYSVERASWREQ